METAESIEIPQDVTPELLPPYRVRGQVGSTRGVPHRKHVTREQRVQMRKMFAQGKRRKEIGEKLGIPITSVSYFKTKLNKELGLDDLDKGALYGDEPRVVFKFKPPPEQKARRGKRGTPQQLPIAPLIATRPLAEAEPIPSLKDWVESNSIILDGNPFTFVNHEYLIEPYTIDHPFTIEEKATQMGLTSLRMLTVMYRAKYRHYRGVLYYFPSKTDVIDFSKTRILPLIEENPETMGNWIQETNSTTVKRLWNTYLYFRGMNSTIGLKSTPADFIVFDELDEALEDRMTMALKRLSHSVFKEVAMLSNPTLPDYGINKQFQKSDQRYWMLKCPKCNQYTCMEDTFPDCIASLNGKVVRLCQSCKDAELNPSIGEWVAKRPSITEKIGWHYSQLFSHFVSPQEIWDEYRTTSHMKHFYNLVVGVPFVEAENRLTVRQVLDLCSDDGIVDYDNGPCSMGVDQMSRMLHVTIGKRVPNKSGKMIHIGIYKDWSELNKLMKNFNVNRCVCDAMPEIRNAREFAEKFKGRVFLNFYREHQRGSYKWDEENMTVMCNRTESLDASHHEVQEGMIVLPKECEIVKTFAEHLHNVGKDLEENEDTGSKRYVYKKLGEDHFRHSFNYECMARQYQVDLLFPELL